MCAAGRKAIRKVGLTGMYGRSDDRRRGFLLR